MSETKAYVGTFEVLFTPPGTLEERVSFLQNDETNVITIESDGSLFSEDDSVVYVKDLDFFFKVKYEELDPSEFSLVVVNDENPNVFNFVTSFYNGGTYLGEVVKELIEKTLKKNLKPLDEYCDLIPIAEFIDDVRMGVFTDDDGIGYLATATEVSDVTVSTSESFENEHVPNWATHVAWYNK